MASTPLSPLSLNGSEKSSLTATRNASAALDTPSYAALRHLWLLHVYVHPRMRLEGFYMYGHSNMYMYVSLYVFRSISCALSVLPRVYPYLYILMRILRFL